MLETPGYAFGPFRLMPGRRLLLRAGRPIPLTPKAFDVLVTLVERRDRVVSKEELLEHLWPGVAVEEANLTQQVFVLRKALGDAGAGEQYIATVPRRGYRFVEDVTLLATDAEDKPPASATPRRIAPRLAVAIAVLFVVGAGAYIGLTKRPPAAYYTMMALTQLTRDTGIESFPSLSPDGREFVYASGPIDYFGEADIYRQDVGLERPFNLTPGSPGADTQPAFSPDGNSIAFRSDRNGGGIFLMARDGTAVRPLSAEGFNPAWSPDGSEVAYATIHTTASPYVNPGLMSALRVVNVRTGARRTIREQGAAQPSWSPHGHRIAYWAVGAIGTCAPDGSDATTLIPKQRDSYNWNPVWSPDGNYLYFSSNRNGVMHLWRVRMDERSGRAIQPPQAAPVPMPSTFVAHPSFDSKGRLAFAALPPKASIERVVFDVAAGKIRGARTRLTEPSHVWVWPEPSPDGRRLAFHELLDDSDVGDLHVGDADGNGIQSLTHERGRDRLARWSRDGRRIAFYSLRGGQSNIWLIDADGRNLRQVTHSVSAPVLFPVWAPDGRIAASEQRPGKRSFVFHPDRPWEDPASLMVLPQPDAATQFIPWSWSADGGYLAGFTRPQKGIVILALATGAYRRLTSEGSTPVWLPDGRRLLYAVDDRLLLLDARTGESRELLNVAPARLELAAGGGFALSAATGQIYLAPSGREGTIWLASPAGVR